MERQKEKTVFETAFYTTPTIRAVCMIQQRVLCGSPIDSGTEKYEEGEDYEEDW